MPPKDAFKAAAYYGTALHELAHWTGHPSRLDRSTLTESYRFGDPNYAKEELRAELASVFLAARRGLQLSALLLHGGFVELAAGVVVEPNQELIESLRVRAPRVRGGETIPYGPKTGSG